MQYLFLPIFISISLASVSQATPTVDPNGYVAFCPCMGRFGNQIDQLLGSLSFAKQLNRTLLLPPLVEYPTGKPAAAMVPFETIFEVSEVAKYHRVIPMGDFMRDLANSIWPKSKRAAFCWRPREGIYDKEAPPSCNAKEGNPFGPFWDYSRIDFVRDVYYGEVIRSGYDLGRHGAKSAWEVNYPAETYPVLAFTGAPGAFPVNAEDRHLQKYLKFRPRITDKAFKFIKESLPRPFVGIHLRNNVDWDRVCDHLKPHTKSRAQLFASAQCIGYNGEKGVLTHEVCQPSEATVLDEVENYVASLGAKSVFVSSDRDHLIPELNDRLKRYNAKAVKLDNDDPHVSLAILTRADHFIGNCISTFSAFVSRSREFGPLQAFRSTSFFGFEPDRARSIEL